MKKLVLLSLCSFFLISGYAQNQSPFALKYLYFTAGGGGRMGESSVNAVFQNHLGLTLAYNKYKDIPNHQYYIPDAFNLMTGYYLNNPYDNYQHYSLRLSKLFKQDRFIQFGIEAGPSFVQYNELISYDTDRNIIGANTNVVFKKHQTVGLSIKTKIGFPLLRFAGMEFATVCNLNTYSAFYGAEINFNLGKIRNKK